MKALNDKNMMTDILYHLKDLMTTMGTAVKESNCEKMRAMLTTLSGKVAEGQFKVFQYMNTHGMYPIENAQTAQIKKTISLHK